MAEHSCLNLREREQKTVMLVAGQSKKTIASVLDRSARGLSKELKRTRRRHGEPYSTSYKVRTSRMVPRVAPGRLGRPMRPAANGADETSRPQVALQPSLVRRRNPRILLIDDDRDLVSALHIWLGSKDCETIAAYNGQDGLDTAIETEPDAIVLDIRMPGMDGLAMLEQLRGHQATARTPAIVYSGKRANVDEIKSDAEKLGIFCYLEKTCTFTVLMDALQSALHSVWSDSPPIHRR